MKAILVHKFGSNGPPTYVAIPVRVITEKIVLWYPVEFYGQSGTHILLDDGELLVSEHHSEILPMILAPD